MSNIGKYIPATVYIVIGHGESFALGPFSPLPIELSVYLVNGTNFSIMRPMMLMNKALEIAGNQGICESRATYAICDTL